MGDTIIYLVISCLVSLVLSFWVVRFLLHYPFLHILLKSWTVLCFR